MCGIMQQKIKIWSQLWQARANKHILYLLKAVNQILWLTKWSEMCACNAYIDVHDIENQIKAKVKYGSFIFKTEN